MKISVATLLLFTTILCIQLASVTLLKIGIMLPGIVLIFGTLYVSLYLRYATKATEASKKNLVHWYSLTLGWTVFNAAVFILLDEFFEIFSKMPG